MCGLCKVKVLEGAHAWSPAELAKLTPSERAEGMRLSCQVVAQGPLRIEIPQSVLAARKFRGQVIRKRNLTRDIVELRIRLMDPSRITFVAGQYVRLQSVPYRDLPSVERAYSIATPPSEAGFVEFLIRRVPGGISTTWIFDILSERDIVEFTGPYGDFHISSSNLPALFIAGGSGLAPFWSILRDLKHKRVHRDIKLFFGALTRDDLLLAEELEKLQSDLPGFRFVPALSKEPQESEWPGERGLIADVVCRLCPDHAPHEAYLCGSPAMIEACLKVLHDKGIADDRIFFDKFV